MLPLLQTKVLYGLRTDVEGNAHFITDTEILYPVGNALSVHDFSQRSQRLIRLPENHEINLITISPNKKYAAVCETGEKPTISIYDLHALKRKKSLGIPSEAATGTTKFQCVSFTMDSKHLIAVTGEPDQTMFCYNWEKGKVQSNVKLANPQHSEALVKVMACNPGDAGIVALGGSYVFKLLTVSETVWRTYGFSKAENMLVCSMAWLNPDRLLFGTRDGRIVYLENGDLKNIYKMSETSMMNLKIREDYVMQTSASQGSLAHINEDDWEPEIRCLTALNRGFAFAFGFRMIVVFEKDRNQKYTRRNLYQIPTQVSKEVKGLLYRVNCIDVSPSSDRLVVTTGWTELFTVQLWGEDTTSLPEPQSLQVLGQHLHHGPISGLSMCAWKPVLMTVGEIDRSVRIWDYEAENLILQKQYSEDISSIALHPTGLFCLIGFNDKLRFMSILIDDLVTVQEFPVRNCKLVGFGHGGHLFAAVNGNVVQVYNTIGFRIKFTLKGHTGKIKSLVWSQSDSKLISIGSEGVIYQWDMTTGNRSGEVIVKGLNLRSIALSSDTKSTYCTASDNKIREIKEKSVAHEFSLNGLEAEYIIMGANDSLILITSPGGIILSLKSPLQEPIEYVDFHIHNTDITKIALSYDEEVLVSTGLDGTLCLWKIIWPELRPMKVDKDFVYMNEVLVGKTELEEKLRLISNLTARMRELDTEHAYKMRQTEVQYNEKMRDVHQGYGEAIEILKDRIDRLQQDHANELNNINVKIMDLKASHEDSMRRMEIKYNDKLMTEFDKYKKFEERTNAMREDYERKLEALEKRSLEEMEKTVRNYEALVHEKKLQLQEMQEEMSNQAGMHKMVKERIEDDADQEIVQIRTDYEILLHAERQANLKLKGEAGVLRNKNVSCQKEIVDLERQVAQLQSDSAQLKRSIETLEKNAMDLKKEVNDRDATIQEKEKRIYELKSNNQELEKYKFVLNHKVNELKGQIEPREKEIEELREKIQNMEAELVNLHKTIVSLELQLNESREKLKASKREAQQESARKRSYEQLIRRIRVDLFDVTALVQEPKALSAAVVNMYHRYNDSEDFARSREADFDAQCEFTKQREHLERTIASLRKQVLQGSGRRSGGVDQESMSLLKEVSSLREELGNARKEIADLRRFCPPERRTHGTEESRIGDFSGKICKGCEDPGKE